jgi:hypothetical protein
MNRKTRVTLILVAGLIIVAGTYVGSTWTVANAPIEKSAMRQVPCPSGQTGPCFQMSVGPPDWAVTLRDLTPWILTVEAVVIAVLTLLTLRKKQH